MTNNKLRVSIALLTLLVISIFATIFVGTKSNVEVVSGWANDKGVQHKIELQSNDIANYDMQNELSKFQSLAFLVEGSGNVEVTIYDANNQVLKNETLSITNNMVTISLSEQEFYIHQNLKFEIKNLSNQSISLKSIDNPEYINGAKETQRYLLTNQVNGEIKSMHKRVYMMGYISSFVIFLVFYIVKRRNNAYQKIVKKVLYKLRKFKLTYFVELVYACVLGFLMLNMYIEFMYVSSIHSIANILILLAMMVFVSLIIELMYDTEGKIECYFIIFSIPILVGYILLMVPNSIPDEIVHFTKAYLTSEFKLGVSPYAYVPKDYSVLTHYNYFEWRELIFHTTNYSDVVKMETCNYNFIAYLIPSFGLMVGRLFEFSITFSYLLARLLNSLVFITFGYHAIKRIPFAKWILLVYLLSPMILQQAGSLSADNLINCVAIFSISYCLYLFKSENEIENKDIIILGCCLCAITITKYIYLPLFGLLFLSYKKIFRIEKRMWFYVLLVFISVAAAYYYFNIYLVSIGEIPEQSAQVKYLKDAGVNSSAQISNMISNPLALLKAIIYTSWNNRMYYLYSMLVTPLSWLTMNIDVFYFYFYSSILGIAILSEEGKNLFKNKFQKVWILTIALMIIITIFVSFYVVFTTVGGTNIEGIQGRYFIPVGLILLILLIGKKKLYLKNPGKIMIVMLYILQLVTMNTMLTFFR